MGPAAVVLASLAAPADPGLDALLGADGAAGLRRVLAVRARRWAAAVAPGMAFEATTPGAAAAALHGHDGPVLLASWDVPGLDAGLAGQALEDLGHGALLSLAPAVDGRPFLVALPRADPELLDLLDGPPEAVFARAAAHEGGLGMLRSERRLAAEQDARALAADPLAPPELLAALGASLRLRAAHEPLLRALYADEAAPAAPGDPRVAAAVRELVAAGLEPRSFRVLPDGRVEVGARGAEGPALHRFLVRDGRVVAIEVVGSSSH